MGFDPASAGVGLEGLPVSNDVVYFDDFIVGGHAAGGKFAETANQGEWLATFTEAGGGDAAINISDDEPGGVVALVNDAADNDSIEIQLNGEAFKVNADKDIYFQARIKVDDADLCDWFIGLATTDTTVIDGTTESIGFRNASNTADIRTICEDNSTETTSDTGEDMADDTFVILSFHVIGNTKVKYFVNGIQKAESITNIPDGDAVTLTAAVQNASAVSRTLEIDYIYCRQPR